MCTMEAMQILLFWLYIELVEKVRRMVRMPMAECTKRRNHLDDCRTRIKKGHCIIILGKKSKILILIIS